MHQDKAYAMQMVSLNVGLPQTVMHRGKAVETGIFKAPVTGRVRLRTLNLDGDGQADLRAHGGPFKAVYAYPHEHYAFWAAETGRDDLRDGQFGENFTVSGLTEDQVCIGDVFRVGTARVQVTQPRVPCFKLGIRMGDALFPKRFLRANRPGFYLRVLEEGEVGAGDLFIREQTDPQRVSVAAINHLLYHDSSDVALARRALRVEALAPGWRESLREMVEQSS